MERRQRVFLKGIGGLWPLAKGSLAKVRKPCIHPNCEACRKGLKHESFIFVFYKAGRQRCMYVPKALVPVLRAAIRNCRRLEKRVSELGEKLIREHRRKRQ